MPKTNVAQAVGFTTLPETSVVGTNGVTIFSKQQLLNKMTVDISANNVTKTNGFTIFPKRLLLNDFTVGILKT